MELVNKNVIAIMDLSQFFLAKSIFQALIHDIDLENLLHGKKAFTRFIWDRLPAELAEYVVCLLAQEIWYGDAEFQSVIATTREWDQKKVRGDSWNDGYRSRRQSRHREDYLWYG